MDTSHPIHLLPTMPMLAESLSAAGFICRPYIPRSETAYRSIRLYHPDMQLQEDVIYLLRPEERGFPVDRFAYLSTVDLGGSANHLICPDRRDEEILDQLLEIFGQFRLWEDAIDLLLYRSASLRDLCQLGAQLLENPVCIHDDWFVMSAMSDEFPQVMEPEYLISSSQGFVPRAVVEDFRYDDDYRETYRHHDAQVWFTPDKNHYTLYVNLWDGPVYRGRLLVSRKNREFLHRDYLIAEALTQRAVFLLRNKQLGDDSIYQNMDDIVFTLLQGQETQAADLNHLMRMLQWQRTDRFLCIRLKEQQPTDNAMMQHLLHRDLFRNFPGSYILLDNREQCIVLNVTQNSMTVPQIRHLLAPLCRDYCQYVGISYPVGGIRELNAAYYQAGVALNQAFLMRSEKWILCFSECAMEHILKILPHPLSPSHLVAPELQALREFDREKGTQYYETFREYLLQERDIPRTSDKLIIHRSTLLYRLKKIQSLIHADLDDPWQRLYLTLSLWILERDGRK